MRAPIFPSPYNFSSHAPCALQTSSLGPLPFICPPRELDQKKLKVPVSGGLCLLPGPTHPLSTCLWL